MALPSYIIFCKHYMDGTMPIREVDFDSDSLSKHVMALVKSKSDACMYQVTCNTLDKDSVGEEEVTMFLVRDKVTAARISFLLQDKC